MEKETQCHRNDKLLKTKRHLLNSIAKEEKALGRLLNAQAKQLENIPACSKTTHLTETTTQLVETVLMKEWLLLRKLEHVLTIESKQKQNDSPPCLFDDE